MRIAAELGHRVWRSKVGAWLAKTKPGVALASRFAHLSRLLPLSTPVTVMIDPTNMCNFKCKFCPTGDPELLSTVKRPSGFMRLGLFKKVVESLREFPEKVSVLHLYKDGEPMLNKQLPEMIHYAKQQNVARSVETTSNGLLLNPRKAIELIESGLDQIKISVQHVDDKAYRELTRTDATYERVLGNVEILYNEKMRRNSHLKISAKIIDWDLKESQRRRFRKDFGRITDSIMIDSPMGWSFSELRDFTLGAVAATGKDGFSPINTSRKICSWPFKNLSVNFNGLVSVCCVDWSWGTVVGNAAEQGLMEIWNGNSLYDLRMTHIKGEKCKIGVCANCHYLAGAHPLTDLDSHAEKLMAKYQKTSGVSPAAL
jgi:MoaA/NifB/PqqE/SkfB family radical SAM enzyme